MKYKGLILNLIVLIAFMILNSCSFGSKKKIGFLVPNFQAGRFKIERDFFTAKVAQLNAVSFVVSAENDENLQCQQAQELIDKKVDVLVVIAVNQYIAAKIVRLAKENGVKVIAYERMIANADIDCYIGSDGKQIGRQMAAYALQKKPSGKVIILGGDKSDDGAPLIHEGVLEVLSPQIDSGKIKVLFDIYIEDWDEENGYAKMEYYTRLTMETPDIILSSYDGLSYGAIRALEKNDLERKGIVITGQDAELKACQYINQGIQTMTLFHPYKLQAETAASIALDLVRKKPIHTDITRFNGLKNVPSVMIESKIIDKSNLQRFMKEEALYSMEEIEAKTNVIN